MTFFNPPTAPYANPPIEPQNFLPNAFVIEAILLGATTTITTATTFYGAVNNYVIGQLVRLVIPVFYGAQELNNQTAYVIAIPGVNQVTLNINSTGYSSFIPSPPYGPTLPQIVAVGDVNSGGINQSPKDLKTFIPGSFINISPN